MLNSSLVFHLVVTDDDAFQDQQTGGCCLWPEAPPDSCLPRGPGTTASSTEPTPAFGSQINHQILPSPLLDEVESYQQAQKEESSSDGDAGYDYHLMVVVVMVA